VFNNNSSRFGKFVKVNFSSSGVIESGRIIDYLLEKNRVVRQNPGERNFHVLYALLAGFTEKDLNLSRNPTDFYYLNQSGVFSDPSIDDKDDYAQMLEAYTAMGFTKAQVTDLTKVLAAILHLGNVSFTQVRRRCQHRCPGTWPRLRRYSPQIFFLAWFLCVRVCVCVFGSFAGGRGAD
jgi:myosin X